MRRIEARRKNAAFASNNAIAGAVILVLTCLFSAVYQKMDQWGLITDTSTVKVKPAIPDPPYEPPPQPVPSRVPPSTLPHAIQPANVARPVKGLMTVAVTQTPRTVDVFVALSEETKHLLEANSPVLDIPIEENFEGLRKYLQDYAEHYDRETERPIQDTEQYRDPALQAIREDTHRIGMQMHRSHRDEERQSVLDEQAEIYKGTNTVYLKQYLENPYRKVVDNPVAAAEYIKRLEKEYLPKIKMALESLKGGQTRRWEF
jgi:hypothetical protein